MRPGDEVMNGSHAEIGGGGSEDEHGEGKEEVKEGHEQAVFLVI
jgi:hypothetical protein